MCMNIFSKGRITTQGNSPFHFCSIIPYRGFLGGSNGKESSCFAGDLGLIPGSVRFLGEGNGNPLQYSCLGNPMDRRAWRATVHGLSNTWTQLRRHTSLCLLLLKIVQLHHLTLLDCSMLAPVCQLLYCTTVLFKVLY